MLWLCAKCFAQRSVTTFNVATHCTISCCFDQVRLTANSPLPHIYQVGHRHGILLQRHMCWLLWLTQASPPEACAVLVPATQHGSGRQRQMQPSSLLAMAWQKTQTAVQPCPAGTTHNKSGQQQIVAEVTIAQQLKDTPMPHNARPVKIAVTVLGIIL